VPLQFDSGNPGSVALTQAEINRVKELPTGELSKGMDDKGNVIEHPRSKFLACDTIVDHFECFVKEQVERGSYASASEVIRDRLRLLEADQQRRQAEIDGLRGEIERGGRRLHRARQSDSRCLVHSRDAATLREDC
jgi:putative addiction module CopG family antidote